MPQIQNKEICANCGYLGDTLPSGELYWCDNSLNTLVDGGGPEPLIVLLDETCDYWESKEELQEYRRKQAGFLEKHKGKGKGV